MMLIRCCFAIIAMVDTIFSASNQSSLKFLLTFGTIHHVLLQHLDFYLDHATFFPAQVWGGDTWEFHRNLLLCISFWLISFYLWLVLVFLFSRVSYGFTPLRHCMSWHYTSQQVVIICMGQFSGECAQFRMDVIILPLNTLELFGD
jgi:hypothetical protein